MGRKEKRRDPVEITVDRLELKGSSGLDARGQRWDVRGAPVGAVVSAWPGRNGQARLIGVARPAPAAAVPECPVFGTCGGCQFQAMPLDTQRSEKQKVVERAAGDLTGVAVHPIVGAPDAYGYRNKLELSFGPRAFVPEAQKDDPDAQREGSFLGFHPPGWFSRIVPVRACPLGSAAMNQVIAAVSAAAPGPAWDTQSHSGAWRHVVVREGEGLLVSLVTSSAAPEAEVRALGAQIAAIPGVRGVLWVVTDRLSEVASGDVAAVLHGEPDLDVVVGHLRLRLPHDAFFQVNTPGAKLLFDRIGDALAPAGGGTLLDLYCGVGAIGLYLAPRFDRVVGVELVEPAIRCARENAARNGVDGEWHAGKVEEVLPRLTAPEPRWIVVDPPRVGLHPDAARFLAGQRAEALAYVACNPASLGRDRRLLEAGGWRMEALWTVDLFPQTPHVEAVARFVRS